MRIALTGMLLAGLVSGCGSSVTMQAPTIPEPLINKIPASVGLRMPAEFDHFVHEEEIIGREHWSIDLGSSNAALFVQLFGFMFDEVIVLQATDDPANFPIDALIEPSIDAFEFSVPNQSKTEAFAVWIRYRIKVFDHEGDEVANWPVSAAGISIAAAATRIASNGACLSQPSKPSPCRTRTLLTLNPCSRTLNLLANTPIRSTL